MHAVVAVHIRSPHTVVVLLMHVMCAGGNKALAGKAGAIQALVSALQTHSRRLGIITAACNALQNLSRNSKRINNSGLRHDATAVYLSKHAGAVVLTAHACI